MRVLGVSIGVCVAKPTLLGRGGQHVRLALALTPAGFRISESRLDGLFSVPHNPYNRYPHYAFVIPLVNRPISQQNCDHSEIVIHSHPRVGDGGRH